MASAMNRGKRTPPPSPGGGVNKADSPSPSLPTRSKCADSTAAAGTTPSFWHIVTQTGSTADDDTRSSLLNRIAICSDSRSAGRIDRGARGASPSENEGARPLGLSARILSSSRSISPRQRDAHRSSSRCFSAFNSPLLCRQASLFSPKQSPICIRNVRGAKGVA
uniref:Uncharacterized protein n=1 Tax=Plectus sambesii TaxID=2011161 RepID=A0A914V3G9_9BILA